MSCRRPNEGRRNGLGATGADQRPRTSPDPLIGPSPLGPLSGRTPPGSAPTTASSSSPLPELARPNLNCALANAAVRRGRSALYLRGPRLHDEIALARLPRFMASWARTDVLVIDDFRLRALSPGESRRGRMGGHPPTGMDRLATSW